MRWCFHRFWKLNFSEKKENFLSIYDCTNACMAMSELAARKTKTRIYYLFPFFAAKQWCLYDFNSGPAQCRKETWSLKTQIDISQSCSFSSHRFYFSISGISSQLTIIAKLKFVIIRFRLHFKYFLHNGGH